jgi:hypothetical protein
MKSPLRFLRVVVCTLALNALFPTHALAQKVLLIAADDPTMVEDVRAKLAGTGLLTQVDVVDVRAPGTTPTLATLLTYDAVLTWSDYEYGDAGALGEALSQYVDSGRGVVQAVFALDPAAPLGLSGRWQTGGYGPFSLGQFAVSPNLFLKALQPQHPILAGVVQFDGGASFHFAGATVSPCGTVVASWSNDEPLVVVCNGPQGGRVVGLNFFPPSSDLSTDFWAAGTDGAVLMANALRFAATQASNQAPTAAAGADQTLEATSPAGAAFTVTGSGTDADGDALTFTWTGAASGSGSILSGTLPAPAAPSKSQSYALTLSVSDGQGGETFDEVVVTVTDTRGPVLSNVPGSTVSTEAGRTAAPYGPITAVDAVDGNRPVTCSPAAPYPAGDTRVTCTSSDTRGNTTTASFTVRASNDSTPGAMVGLGVVRAGALFHEFGFSVRERGTNERGLLELHVTDHLRRGRSDRFRARTTDAVAFSDDPTVRPGRATRPQVDTVLFSGIGEWNGRGGYRYEVFAVDRGDSWRQRESVRITIKAPNGTTVAHVDGVLSAGFIESVRLRH